MAILTHGSDLTLAPTLAPLLTSGGGAGGTVREAVEQLSAAGFTAVQLSAATPGIRPRDLDQRARKDLLALLARRAMRLAGLDLFIPRRHFVESEHMDRAVAATLSAIELAADLGRVPVSIALPVEKISADIRLALAQAADGHGVAVAVHAEDQIPALLQWVEEVDLSGAGAGLGVAIDPAAVLGRSGDPVEMVQKLGPKLRVARLSDLSAGSDLADGDASSRCVVGEGDLDVIPYRVALDLATARRGPVVLELRGLPQPFTAARIARRVWEKSAFSM